MNWTANVINVAGLVIGVIGIILAILFGLRSRRCKKILCVARKFNLLGRPLAGLPHFQAQYDGERLENLTAVKFLMWNRGSETLTPNDFAKADPLRIVLEVDPETPSRILEACVVESTNSKCGAALSFESPSERRILFEFLAPGDAILLSVLHSGAGRDPIALRGTLKGGDGPRAPRLMRHSWGVDLLASAAGGVLFMAASWLISSRSIAQLPAYVQVPLVIGGAIGAMLALFSLLAALRPKGQPSVRVSGGRLDAAYLDDFKPGIFRKE